MWVLMAACWDEDTPQLLPKPNINIMTSSRPIITSSRLRYDVIQALIMLSSTARYDVIQTRYEVIQIQIRL